MLLVLLLTPGCSPMKRAMKVSEQMAGNAGIVVSEVQHDRIDTSTTTEAASDEEIVTTRREYDTDKPIDPATGTPPLKRETTQTRRKVEAERETQTTGQTTDRQLDVVEQQQAEVVVQADTAEKRGENIIQRVLIAIGVLAAGVIIFKLFKPNILTL
jgi:hypothetical protein